MDFEILLACDSKWGLGANNGQSIPWRKEIDMQFFKNLTTQIPENSNLINAIVMGRKTADTFKKTLSKRLNVVITSQKNYRVDENFITCSSLDELKLDNIHKVFVIGGGQLAEAAINHPRCRGIYLNIINGDYNCDVRLSDVFLQKMKKHYVLNSKTISDDITFTKYVYVNFGETKYIDMLENIIMLGHCRKTRNAETYSVFGEKLVFDLENGFPLLTTKKMFYRGIFEELIFFLSGKTDTKLLENKKVMIWHENTTKKFIENNNKNLEEYDMGPMYGFQWRHYGAQYKGCHYNYEGEGIDQIALVIDTIIKDPYSRRILLSTYNPAQAEEGVLYPCHGIVVQFYVEKNSKISLQMYQRSVDSVLGLPFNIASYAALLYIIVELVNNNVNRTHVDDYVAGRVVMILGDVHIYSEHIESVNKQLCLVEQTYPFPTFKLTKKLSRIEDLQTLQASDMEITNYICHPAIKTAMIP